MDERIARVSIDSVHDRLGFTEPLHLPDSHRTKPLIDWSMEENDAPILRWLFRNFRPDRHLEFGTLQGVGTLCCLEECRATVWTLNLLQGELDQSGDMAYAELVEPQDVRPWENIRTFQNEHGAPVLWRQNDALGSIGRLYRNHGFGGRVCQIYSDSRKWDISRYPKGFFDTVFIDGGHQPLTVANDTFLALKLLRPGGLIIWHDFCPDQSVLERLKPQRGVFQAILGCWDRISNTLNDLFWIQPSWLLVGKAGELQARASDNADLCLSELSHASRLERVDLSTQETYTQSLQEQIADKDRLIVELHQKHAHQIRSIQSDIEEKNKKIEALYSEINAKDRKIEDLYHIIKQKDEDLQDKQGLLQKLEHFVQKNKKL